VSEYCPGASRYTLIFIEVGSQDSVVALS
jgi:hypothetical protein